MLKITGKQCRAARSLLKWNLHDLANHVSKMPPKRLDSFEHGMVHLLEWEHSELLQAFKKAGIVFKADLEVALQKTEADSASVKIGGDGVGARIQLDGELNIVADSSAQKVTGLKEERGEEENRMDGKKNPG